MLRRLFTHAVTLPLLLLLGAAPALAQATSSLKGRVLDESGEPLPGVVVKLANPSAPVGKPVMITDLDGHFFFPSLPPGREYTLTASVPDYATVVAGPLELKAGRETRLDLTLRKSSDLQETVRVEARGDVVDISTTAVETAYNSEFIEGLPLVGRSFEDLLVLAPGITDADGDGNVNVRGSRETGLQLRLDGSNVTNPVTGLSAQNVNLESIEELELVTAGAAAEYGRADGGFANVITKSGGNDTTGSLKLFYRSDFLDGSGSSGSEDGITPFTDLNLYGTLGGALVKDHAWYFVAAERLEEELPVNFEGGETRLKSLEGWHNFAKLTFQTSQRHKLTLQVNMDPVELLGNNFGPTVDPETDFLLSTGGTLPQVSWTAILSPALLLQMVASRLDGRTEIDPVGDGFHPIQTGQRIDSMRFINAEFPCRTWNCDGDPIRRLLFDEGEPQRENGVYNVRSGVDVTRHTLRTDLSLTIEEALGQHAIKTGFLYEVEDYREDLVTNPIVTDRTCSFPEPGCTIPAPAQFRDGTLTLQIFDPLRDTLAASSWNMGTYVQDSWRVRPNLSINAGVRVDWEQVTTQGYTFFEPGPEAREALRRYDIVCEAAGSGCSQRTPGRRNGVISAPFDITPDSPAAEFDVNGDLRIDLSGAERDIVLNDPFTIPSERTSESFGIDNTNLSPRLSASWDPWADGKTKMYATWGRYYDRLFLGAVVTEQTPSSYVAQWDLFPNAAGQVQPDELSQPVRTSYNIPQTDRDLRTPHTDEFTVGIERELATEWALGVTYIHRRSRDLLQDVDVNHITCEGFDDTLGVDPYRVCGDGGQLELDKFGTIACGDLGCAILRNEAPDLYNLSPFYNQVLRVGNFNSSRYEAYEVTLRKRLHRNWQMLAAYTWSTAEGDAESFSSAQGNDPAVSDKVSGYLDYDQRHVFKLQTTAHLPREILVGTSVLWASGLPYSFISNVEDYDDQTLLTPQRIFSITGKKNDQRNESQFTFSARVEKRFDLQRLRMSGFISGENLLNRDELVLRQVNRDQRGIIAGERRFGRRFEMGMSILF
jgi:outer membrane receptor protein involved in Fe transport